MAPISKSSFMRFMRDSALATLCEEPLLRGALAAGAGAALGTATVTVCPFLISSRLRCESATVCSRFAICSSVTVLCTWAMTSPASTCSPSATTFSVIIALPCTFAATSELVTCAS